MESNSDIQLTQQVGAVDGDAAVVQQERRSPLLPQGVDAAAVARHLATIRDVLTCPICRDVMAGPAILVCGHMFCYDCINNGLENGVIREPIVVALDPSGDGEGRSGGKEKEGATRNTGNTVAGAKTAAPRAPRAPKPLTFCCPICETPAYKWTIMRLPSVENYIQSITSAGGARPRSE